jgi:hypothetical protein
MLAQKPPLLAGAASHKVKRTLTYRTSSDGASGFGRAGGERGDVLVYLLLSTKRIDMRRGPGIGLMLPQGRTSPRRAAVVYQGEGVALMGRRIG